MAAATHASRAGGGHHPRSHSVPPGEVTEHNGEVQTAGISLEDPALMKRLEAEDTAEYRIAEHKTEVRLGLKHRNSFAIHKTHLHTSTSSKPQGGLLTSLGSRRSGSAGSEADAALDDNLDDVVDSLVGDTTPRRTSGGAGVSSFFGFGKAKREEAALAALDIAAYVPINEGRKRFTLTTFFAPLPLPAGAGTQKTAPSFFAIPTGGASASSGRAGDASPKAPLPARGRGGAPPAGPPGAPPPATPLTAAQRAAAATAAAAAAAAAGERSGGGAPPPPPPNRPPAASPPARGAGGLQPTPPPMPAPPKSPALSPGSGRKDTPTRGILKTARGDSSAAASVGSPPGLASPASTELKRSISFADSHGHDLEYVRWCDNLHYSANADHSEIEFEEIEDRNNCSIM